MKFHVPGARPDTSQGFSKHEKRRLLILTAGTMVVGVAILAGLWKSREGAQNKPALGDELEFEERVAAPQIDAGAIDKLVSDAAPDERVILEGEALDTLGALVRNMTPGQYLALGLRDLTPALTAELFEAPSRHRGQPFTLRGWVDSIRTRNRRGHPEHIARLRLEGSGIEGEDYAYFVAQKIPEPLLEGDFVRIDGLFMKIFSDESQEESGLWLEGPLLVGRNAQRSVAAFGPVTRLDPRIYADVTDDDVLAEDGRPVDPKTAIPYRPMWNLMAYARDLPEGAIDWSQATKLDDAALRELAQSGQEHRLQPYTIPISQVQDARVKVAPENPARIAQYTEGWIGHPTWSNVIRFSGPFQLRGAEVSDLIEARGFFLKNFSYVSKERGLRTAPYFVLTSMELVHPEPAPIYGKIVRGMFIGTLVFLAGFVILVLRSSKRSKALQADLLRRRQERRRKRTPQGHGV